MTQRPERVLFLPKWYPDASDPQLGIFIREHAETLAQALSLSVLYAYPDPTGTMRMEPQVDHDRGFTEIIVPYKSQGPRPLRLFRYFKALKKGWKKLLEEGAAPELTHVHVLNRPACFAYWLERKYGIPFVITEHWSGYIDGKANERPYPLRKATSFLLRKAKGVTVVSERLAGSIKSYGGPEPQVVPNSVKDPGPPSPIPSSPFRFLNVSDMVEDRKNVTGLVEAYEELQKERQLPIELHLVGGGPDEELIRDLVEKKGLLGKGIEIHGRLPNEEVQALIPKMSAVIVNSLFETFSVVTVESLVHGRPVAASVCGGPEHILEDGKDGVLFSKGDRKASKKAMEQLLDGIGNFDPQELHDRIIAQYGRNEVRDRFLRFYEEVMKER